MIIVPEKNLVLAETSYELLRGAGWLIQQDMDSAEEVEGIWFTNWFAAHAGTGQVVKLVLASTGEPNSETYLDAADHFVDRLAGWPIDEEEEAK